MTVVYLFALIAGLGCWLPAPGSERRDWIGFLFLQSWLLFIVLLYFGDVVLGIPLSKLVPVFAAISGAGPLFRLYRTPLSFNLVVARGLHPIWVLMAMTCAVIYAHGGIEYLPMPGDETASWLRLARQIFLVDAYWSPAVDYHLGAYTNGWPLFIAFTNSIHGFYDDGHGVAVAFIMQLGLIGATFDVSRYIVSQENLKITPRAVFLGCWVFVLGLLAAEVSWILMPTFQLIDEPLIFAFMGCFLTAFLGLYDSCDRRLIAIYLGISLASAYLLKMAAMALVPATLVFLLAFACKESGLRLRDCLSRWRSENVPQLLMFGALVFAPLLIVNMSWDYFKIGSNCMASPVQLLTGGTGQAAHQPLAIVIGFATAAAGFFISYKLALSLVATASLVTGAFCEKSRWLVIAFVGVVCVYTVALFFGYVSCFDVFELGSFEALPRYLRTPLRVAHHLGLIVLLMLAARAFARRQQLLYFLNSRGLFIAALIFIGALLGWQVRSVSNSLDDMRTRDRQDPVLRTAIITIKEHAAVIAAEVERRHLSHPSMSLIAQGGYGVEFDLAMYFGIKSQPDGASNFIYIPRRPYSWTAEQGNIFTEVTTPDKLEAYWRGFDILWPYRIDDWTREILRKLSNGPACRENPGGYFLFRTPSGDFDCVAKPHPSTG